MSIGLDILVVDDEAGQRDIVAEILTDEGHQLTAVAGGEAALSHLRESACDLLITDMRMPGMDGVTLLTEARRTQPDLTVILMTAHATVASAVEAMKQGAHDYLQKPFSKDELVQRVSRVAERVALLKENRRLRSELEGQAAEILGKSPVMEKLRRHVDRLASAPGDVLITGESGTGKELVARRLHYRGPRAGGPFVAVNCAAIPESLAESELFGHEKGAFTHAVSARAGRFEQANGGTLFLDEIASMPLPLQAKLLRVLQDRAVERVGGDRPRRIDIRVVSATNRHLPDLIKEGRFREDLYHRLNVLEIHVPPLRERREDVPELTRVFRDRAAVRYDVPPPDLGEDLLRFLDRYPFSGNVRELEHLMEKMVVLSEGEPLGVADLPPSIDLTLAGPSDTSLTGAGADAAPVGDTPESAPESLLRSGTVSLTEVERRLLQEAIRQSSGNLSEAAKRLGISYKTMRYRARKFGLIDHDGAD